jgi:D-alanyl-D-alanine carboxypeptidase
MNAGWPCVDAPPPENLAFALHLVCRARHWDRSRTQEHLMDRRLFLTAGGASLALAARAAAARDTMAARITPSAGREGFGGAILVEQRGRIVYERQFRQANIPFQVANSSRTRYRIASVTKLFTAVLVMRLVEQHRLSLGHTLKEALPDYPGEGGERINLHQLLTATSGLRDFGGVDEEAYKASWTEAEIVERFCSGPLAFPPGSKFSYNNADYYLLGKILEAAHRQPFSSVLAAEILQPLSMRDTGMANTAGIIPRLATPYVRDRQNDALSNEPHFHIENYGAAGAMYSSPRDLLIFSQALFRGKLLAPATLTKLLTPNLSDYAMGLWLFNRTLDGKTIRMAERQGAIAATGARLVRLLDYDATVVLLANIWPRNMDGLLRDIVQELVS